MIITELQAILFYSFVPFVSTEYAKRNQTTPLRLTRWWILGWGVALRYHLHHQSYLSTWTPFWGSMTIYHKWSSSLRLNMLGLYSCKKTEYMTIRTAMQFISMGTMFSGGRSPNLTNRGHVKTFVYHSSWKINRTSIRCKPLSALRFGSSNNINNPSDI